MTRGVLTTRIAAIGAGILIMLFLLGPLAVAIAMSLGTGPIMRFPPKGFTWSWYSEVISSSSWTHPALTSLYVALMVAAFASVLGVAASFALVRGGMRFQGLFTAVLILPLITPSIILALGMALMFGRLHMTDSMWGLALAQSVLAMPFVVINCMVSLRGVDRSLERAAASLGANPLRVFALVTFPLMSRGVLAGAVFAFLASWDDAVISVFLRRVSLVTLPAYLLGQVREAVSPTVAAAGGLLTLVGIFMCSLVVLSGVRRTTPRPERAEPA
jgi:putative spermidine/putrescine transport system permease protein